ncbi:MAG: DUF2877 domain-containing protein [Sphaerochaeta sp.]|nr:DUF2877 domain-containing protein [Sphaerochaeta sp.]
MHTGWSSTCLGTAERIGSRFPLSPDMLIVHSVYATTINLQDTNGTLYSIVTKKLACHPAAVLIDNGIRFDTTVSARVYPGSTATVREEGLFFNCGLWVSFLGATRVHPTQESAPGASMVPTTVIRRRMELLDSMQKKHETVIQIFQQVGIAPVGQSFFQRFHQTLANLSTSIKRQTVPDSIETIRSLVGFGPGSTPAGDDFLCGLILSWHMHIGKESAQNHFHKYLVAEIKTMLVDDNRITTAISRMFLLLACEGLFSDSLLLLARAWASTESDDTDYLGALAAVSEIGHSSGLDAAFGMVYGFSHHRMDVA